MDAIDFLNKVLLFLNKEYAIKEKDMFIVWSCKVLHNNKCMIGVKDSDKYFECVYDGVKDKLYINTYKHVLHEPVAYFTNYGKVVNNG